MGEGDAPLFIGMIVFTTLAEIIRKLTDYDKLAYSFYAFTAHWWTDTEGALQAAMEEMRPGHDDLMKPVIANIPGLVIALILIIPVAALGMKLAEKVMKKQAVMLK